MDVCYILLLLLVVGSVTEIFLYDKKYVLIMSYGNCINIHKLAIFLITCTFIMISGLRNINVGKDLINYIPRFITLGNASWSEIIALSDQYSFEYGFSVFCKILYLINPSPYFFLLITSIIIGVGFYLLCQYSHLPVVTFFLIYSYGLWGSSLNIIRQFIALTFLIVSIKYIIERKFGKFVVCIIIAISFHSISIVFLPLYFLYKIKFDSKTFIYYLGLSILTAILGYRFLEEIISNTSFAWYLEGGNTGSGESTLILLSAILLGAFIFRKSIYKIDNKIDLWIWGLAIAILFNILALSLGIFARVMKFFLPFLTIIIPDIVLAIRKDKALSLGIWTMILGFFCIYFYFVIVMNTSIGEGWNPFIFR